MRKLFYAALMIAAMVATVGCAITDYPMITDERGDYTGLIRTAHKAYIVPTSQVATIYDDGSDELFSMVYQNQYGDQTLYTFNNFDPTASALFLDQTYCDWRYEGCEIVRAWNPRQNDEEFDYELFPDCSGARSLSLIVGQTERLGECGDTMFADDKQALHGVFADLDTTSWRGGSVYVVPMNNSNTTVNLTSMAGVTETAPIFGNFTGYITEDLNLMVPMTPNVKHELNWARQWAADHGNTATMSITYEDVTAEFGVTLRTEGLSHNGGRI
jgi:hypothetical protein